MEAESEDDIMALQSSLERPAQHRGNTMVHVCWHRSTSVSMVDFSVATEVPVKPRRSAPGLLLPAASCSLCLSVCCLSAHFDDLSLGTVSSCAARRRKYLLRFLRTEFWDLCGNDMIQSSTGPQILFNSVYITAQLVLVGILEFSSFVIFFHFDVDVLN